MVIRKGDEIQVQLGNDVVIDDLTEKTPPKGATFWVFVLYRRLGFIVAETPEGKVFTLGRKDFIVLA